MIYNDIFSKSINFFGSSFIAPKPDINEKGLPQFLNSSQGMIPHFDMNQDYVYWFGVDPVNFSRIERWIVCNYNNFLGLAISPKQGYLSEHLQNEDFCYYWCAANVFWRNVKLI